MKCSYCDACLQKSEYSNNIYGIVFCGVCTEAIQRMTPEEEKIQEKYIDQEDGQVYYY
jgi:hypothetical protein